MLSTSSAMRDLTPLDLVLRRVSRAVTRFGPPPPTRLLRPVRVEACDEVLSNHRKQSAELGERVRAGDSAARDDLAALADQALLEMRALVRTKAATRGVWTNAAAVGDAMWNNCDKDELLDDPELDEALRRRIMLRLDRFNVGFNVYEQCFSMLLPLLNEHGPTRVLDLAAGHGGFARAATRRTGALGLDVRFTVSDLMPEYLDMGAALARDEELPVEFVVQDALDLSNLDEGAYDIIVCTQSLHHFPAGLVTLMFEAATRAASRGVVFVDLSRSIMSGATVAALGAAHGDRAFAHDGWVSTRKGFVPQELALLARLGRRRGALESRWIAPAHCLLRWTP